MKIVYVTGCLGFIGSHFVRKCLKLGWYVYGVDKITYAANESLLEELTVIILLTLRQNLMSGIVS